jgi:Family of unknown function (DUF6526)
MAEKVPQNLANHTRFDPLFHFFALPVVFLTVIVAIVHFVQRRSFFSAWLVVFVIAMVIVTVRARMNALKVQDRLIRLEERERIAGLVSEPLRSRIAELTESQLIGLRFASDAEIPALVQETLNKKLSRSDIKKAIKNWRPDSFRV